MGRHQYSCQEIVMGNELHWTPKNWLSDALTAALVGHVLSCATNWCRFLVMNYFMNFYCIFCWNFPESAFSVPCSHTSTWIDPSFSVFDSFFPSPLWIPQQWIEAGFGTQESLDLQELPWSWTVSAKSRVFCAGNKLLALARTFLSAATSSACPISWAGTYLSRSLSACLLDWRREPDCQAVSHWESSRPCFC